MVTALIALLLTSSAHAGDVIFTQQGRLVDTTGTPIEGSHRLDVSLYTALEDGTEVWHGRFDTVQFEQGRYLVTLNGPGTLGTDLDVVTADGGPLYLELHVDNSADGPLTPRQRLSYVPAAAHAARAGGSVLVDLDVDGMSCSVAGGFGYDVSREALYVCNGTEWFVAGALDRPPVTFSYTGSDQSWTVPAGVTEVTILAWGAGGGAGRVASIRGGAGGFTRATVPVSPGQTLTVVVGEGGPFIASPTGAGKGGGLSGVFTGTPSQATALVLAGGGGGGGYYASTLGGSYGGNGGGSAGLDGAATDSSYYDSRGRGATTSAGGAGGCYSGGYCGSTGTALQGGYGGSYPGYSADVGTYGGGGGHGRSASYNAGGGGGGYWGGGGGSNNAPLGGGGGSGFVVAGATSTMNVTSSVVGEPPLMSDSLYPEGVALGGDRNGVSSGGHGFVVIDP